MANSIIQGIGVASSQILQNTQAAPAPKDTHGLQNPAQVIQSAQVAAQKSIGRLKSDESRTPQIPKRVEDPFASRSPKRKAGQDVKEEEKEKGPVDVVA